MNTEDIQKLAHLARISLSKEELETLNINAVLDYIKAIESAPISELSGSSVVNDSMVYNVTREDIHIDASIKTKDLIIKNFPKQKNRYLEVSKILNND